MYHDHMNRSVQISTHMDSLDILNWLHAHVGAITAQGMFSAYGSGWLWHYATGVRLSDGSPITRMHRIEFEDDVDADLITQFALTFG